VKTQLTPLLTPEALQTTKQKGMVAMSVPVIGILVASVMARRTGKFVRARTPAPGTVSG